MIVNYGMGNLRSVVNAFAAVGREVNVSADPRDLDHAGSIVLPGVGAFGDGMANLRNGGWLDPLTAAAARGAPVLGICLG
ncbi:MAG: imidazole glycerol phosphate synthase subunit HisH, partial [Actinomycetota bacterium]|nr:imidazole glycerol phosphate synthase subunit HisH [Actinomycetota bacterium]